MTFYVFFFLLLPIEYQKRQSVSLLFESCFCIFIYLMIVFYLKDVYIIPDRR